MVETGKHVQKSGLTGTGTSDERDELTATYIEVHRLNSVNRLTRELVFTSYVDRLDDRRGGTTRISLSELISRLTQVSPFHLLRPLELDVQCLDRPACLVEFVPNLQSR